MRAVGSAGIALLVAGLVALDPGSARTAGHAPAGNPDTEARSSRSVRTASLCRDGIARDLELRLARLSESTTLCPGSQIAEPRGEWSCEPTAPPPALRPCGESETPSPLCGMASRCREGFVACRHAFRCRPETPDYNREVLRRRRQARLREDFARLRAPPARTSGEAGCGAFPDHLSRCAAFHCREPHPTLPALDVERSVLGLEGGACVFRERVTGGLSLECRMDEASRARYADRLRMLRSEPATPGTGEPPLDLAAEALAASRCEPAPAQ